MLSRYACPCCGVMPKDELIRHVEDLEKEWGKRLQINSCMRCQKRNNMLIERWKRLKEKGIDSPQPAKHSLHMEGIAVDIGMINKEDQERLILLAEKVGFRGIGRYFWGTHIDLGEQRFW
jgi:uncharacterized protein YcbK (DUF882 family)